MIGDIGMQELMVIFLIVLLLFGADRIPALARGLGKGVREFKRVVNNANTEIQRAIDIDENEPPPRKPPPPKEKELDRVLRHRDNRSVKWACRPAGRCAPFYLILNPKSDLRTLEMSTASLRTDVRCIFDAALQAVDPAVANRRHVVRSGNSLNINGIACDLDRFNNIYVVGAGKAGAMMACAMETILGGRLTGGIVNVKYGHTTPLQCVELIEAGHPIPDAAGVEGTEKIVKLLERLGADDLVFCLLSGGGSALMPLPAAGVTLEEKQAVTGRLLQCGATINEINTVRKHISRVKGGQLASLASPASLVSLVLSDVIGDPLDIIASGPTVPDESTYSDSGTILEKCGLGKRSSSFGDSSRGLPE